MVTDRVVLKSNRNWARVKYARAVQYLFTSFKLYTNDGVILAVKLLVNFSPAREKLLEAVQILRERGSEITI